MKSNKVASIILLLLIYFCIQTYTPSLSYSSDIDSINKNRSGTLTTPDGYKLDLKLDYINNNMYIILKNKQYKALDITHYADNAIQFYIQLDSNNKLMFKGYRTDSTDFSGTVTDVTGKQGFWEVHNSSIIEENNNKLSNDFWEGKITTPDKKRLNINIKTVDGQMYLVIDFNRYKINDATFSSNNRFDFYIQTSDNYTSRLYFQGEIVDDWILAGKVFDQYGKSGSWLVKKALDEYNFTNVAGDKLITGTQIVEVNDTEKSSGPILIKIKNFDIDPSAILSDEDLEEILLPSIGKVLAPQDIRTLIDQINDIYVKKGYITAKAFLPPQSIDNGIVKITLVEGHIGEITLSGNKHTRDNYILDKFSQESGDLFELETLKKNIQQFNRLNTVKLKANLKPGEKLGTTDVEIVAIDPNPYHLTPTFDNTGRESIGVLRGGLLFSSDSVLGYRDQFTAGYSRAKDTNLAYAGYNFPVGNRGTKLGASFSYCDIAIGSGPFRPLNIEGNAYNYSGYVSHPFISTDKFDFIGDIGVNLRQSTTFIDKAPIFTTQVRNLEIGLNFEYRDKYGRWMSRHSFTNGLDILGGNSKFFKYNGNLIRLHNFGHGIVGIFRAATQLTDDRLPPIEQFQIGGSPTVRGYSEGLLLGDSGYFVSGELRFPLPFLPKEIGSLMVRDRVSGVVFIDHGGAFPDDGDTTSPHTKDFLTGIGVGLRTAVSRFVSGRVDWGFGLGAREPDQPTARIHFGLQANPF